MDYVTAESKFMKGTVSQIPAFNPPFPVRQKMNFVLAK